MTIHSGHPFPADDDPARRLRGRLGGTVALWTAGDHVGRAGLTVTSMMLANGAAPRLLALVDPDSDLAETVARTGLAMVQLLSWQHRDLADAFAGVAPAPGGAFRTGTFADTEWGPRLAEATAWAGVRLESTAEVGWSLLLCAVVDDIVVGEDDPRPLLHRRGRYLTLPDVTERPDGGNG